MAPPDRLDGIYPSVREVLDLPAVREGGPVVRAGEPSLGRSVRWTHAAEVADVARLLKGGELLLTTGVLLPSDDAGLADYVRGLAHAGVTGVLVEVGRRFDRLPDAMVAAADQSGLVLVELTHEVRFAAVTEAVHARIVDAQLAELRASDEVHAAFTELTVEGAPPTEIVRQVARMAGFPVVLENLAHQVLAVDAAGGTSPRCSTGGRTGAGRCGSGSARRTTRAAAGCSPRSVPAVRTGDASCS